jgi:TIR domain
MPKLEIFISYPVKDGFDKANEAANILKKVGHKAWICDHSKTIGALVWREIANCIVNESDVILYICTSSSLHSWGQGQEAGYALNNRKKIIVVCLDDASVPIELTARWYEKLPSAQFGEKFGRIAIMLPDITNNIQRLDEGIVAKIT